MRVLLLLLLLGGCARDSVEALEAKLGGLVGRPVAELAVRMGVPRVVAREEAAGGETALAYRIVWPDTGQDVLPIPYAPRNRVCDIVFTSRGGRVTGYRYAGEACGWAGLPHIAP